MFAKWIEKDQRFAFSLTDNGGVEISDAEHHAFLDGISAGKIPSADKKGLPVLSDPPPHPAPTYAELRARAYPPITDYLDGLVKGDQDQVEKYIEACRQVKLRYPK